MKQIGLSVLLVAVWVLAASLSKADSIALALEIDANGHLRVPVTMENGESYDFILDTAASRTSLMQALVDELGLQPDAENSGTLYGTTGSSQIAMYPPMRIKVGGELEYQTPPLPALGDLHIPNEPFYGILGSDFFEEFVVEIDAVGGRLVLGSENPLSSTEQDSFGVAEIRPHAEGIWVLDTQVGDVEVTAILDTGARNSILNVAAATAMGVQLPESFADGSEEINGATGHSARGIALQLGSLQAGDREWLNPHVAVADIPIFDTLGLGSEPAMMLASDLLLRGRLVVDYKHRLVYFEKMAATTAGH